MKDARAQQGFLSTDLKVMVKSKETKIEDDVQVFDNEIQAELEELKEENELMEERRYQEYQHALEEWKFKKLAQEANDGENAVSSPLTPAGRITGNGTINHARNGSFQDITNGSDFDETFTKKKNSKKSNNESSGLEGDSTQVEKSDSAKSTEQVTKKEWFEYNKL